MALISFTPEELEELKRIDAMIDADEDLTDQEIVDSWNRERNLKPRTSEKQREYNRMYYQKNREHLLEKARARYHLRRDYLAEYREKNREVINAKQRIYMKENAEARRQYQKKRYDANRERFNAKSRDYYQRNKEKCKAYSKEYYHKNKEKFREYHRKYYHRRKSENDESTGKAAGHGRSDPAAAAEGSC